MRNLQDAIDLPVDVIRGIQDRMRHRPGQPDSRSNPTPEQILVVHQVMAEVQAGPRGLRLPRVYVSFVATPQGVHRGETFARDSGRVEVYFNGRIAPPALYGVVAHELAHVHDLYSGQDWSVIEMEQQAIAFAERWR